MAIARLSTSLNYIAAHIHQFVTTRCSTAIKCRTRAGASSERHSNVPVKVADIFAFGIPSTKACFNAPPPLVFALIDNDTVSEGHSELTRKVCSMRSLKTVARTITDF